LNNTIKLSDTPAENRCKAPELGEHSDEILTELGYSQEKIEELRKTGII
jgi:crotonobetainyl-CoA:carnitine CoA-transferase CaiB-like acyl-CoA transferase